MKVEQIADSSHSMLAESKLPSFSVSSFGDINVTPLKGQ